MVGIKVIMRNLWKNKGLSLINIGGLAIGFTCSLFLLLYVDYERGFNKQFKSIDNIYYTKVNIKLNNELVTFDASPNILAPTALKTIPGIANASRLSFETTSLFNYGQSAFKQKILFADPSFLKIFDYEYLNGNPSTALASPESILITSSTARKLFGNQAPIGKSIKWDNRKLLTVAAVIKDLPENQSNQFDILLPWALYEQENPDVKNSGWGNINARTVITLSDKNGFDAADASFRKLIKSNVSETIMEAFLFPYDKIYLYNEFKNGRSVGGKIDQVNLFLGMAFCVLLIACINYMNLSTARSEKRAKEVGIRKALGSSRVAVATQFLLESLFTSVLAVIIAFALAELALPAINQILNIEMRIEYNSCRFWIVLSSLVFFTGLLSGSYPAFYLSSFLPVKVLKGFNGSGLGSLSIRRFLVVLQFSLSICMIISAIIIYNQVKFIQQKPLGFEKNNLAQIAIEGELLKPGKLELLKKELIASGAVSSSTEYANSFVSEGGPATGEVYWDGKPAKTSISFNYRSIGYNFIETVGTQITAGRDFSSKFVTDSTASVLLNEAAVKVMQLRNTVGTKITWEGKPLNVIGVVKNYNNSSVLFNPQPTLFYYGISQSTMLLLRLNPQQNLTKSVQTIKDLYLRLNPSYPADIQFIDHEMRDKLKNEKLLGTLSALFGCFAILISCLGLLGLALYVVEQRSREISIRKVLGATHKSVLILLNKDFIKLVFLSNIIAIPVAYVLTTEWLQKYDYHTQMNIWPFLLSTILSLSIAVVTVSFQIFKVASANPIDALKYE
jgi:putative ABC transport system permease protein